MPASVLLLLPALNEEKALQALSKEIPKKYSVVVVDSQSTDGTVEVARSLGYAAIPVSYGRGKGSGVRTGMDYFLKGRWDYLALIDCDYSDDPADVEGAIKFLKDSGLDVVMGIRDMRKQHRFLGVATAVVKSVMPPLSRLAIGRRISDPVTGFYVFRRSAVEAVLPSLRCVDFEFDFEVIYHMWRLGIRFGEYPVNFRRRIGVTKFTHLLRLKHFYYAGKYTAFSLRDRITGTAKIKA
ncbi:Glycosyltransferase AglJ [uncultured archaeon]|nr:Glycosyltransferase AglJ [uncultured archaeon]